MIEPASAVPIDAPRFVIVFWTPPTSGLCSSGTAETVTAPSCEASAPMPSPTRSIGTKTISGPGVGVERRRAGRPCPRAARAGRARTTSRGETLGKRRGMPIAATSSVSESGSSRTPVSSADSPRQTERYSGTTKKRPACTRYWKKNIDQPAAQLPVPQHRRADERLPAPRLAGAPPSGRRARSRTGRSRISQTRRREAGPRRRRPASAGPSPTRSERSTPNTSRPRPSADSTAPTRSRRGRCLDRRVGDPPREQRGCASTITTSPAKTQRQEK